eukprot:15393785-Heterocapsa_arctica.AAC.1
MRNEPLLGPHGAPQGTDTKVTSAKGHFCGSLSLAHECHTPNPDHKDSPQDLARVCVDLGQILKNVLLALGIGLKLRIY